MKYACKQRNVPNKGQRTMLRWTWLLWTVLLSSTLEELFHCMNGICCCAVQQDCNSTNNLAWTNNNALPCSDNNPCTKNDQCSNGDCSGTPITCLSCEECYNATCQLKPGFCAITDGGTRKCVNGGALRPGYPCQVKELLTIAYTAVISLLSAYYLISNTCSWNNC